MVNLDRTNLQPGTIRLRYELFRFCDSGKPISLGIWMFDKVNVTNDFFDSIEESFSFIFCECLTCNGCFEYFVTVTPIGISTTGIISEVFTVTVSNGRMAVLAQEG
ncbi:DUF4489 domain-containing protein [Wukongibacter baidiensis]|uniref:DUF4489 domain-containing protein n=1 Tax=Wukongibacter baidiensis TaxID=1723361 RepID=UPI003D7F1AB8